MKYQIFKDICKEIVTQNAKLVKRKLKRDYYNTFLPELNNYNKKNKTNIVINSVEYDDLFKKAITDGSFIGNCPTCGYRLSY